MDISLFWVTGALYVYFKTAKIETQQNTWGKRHKVGISYHPLAKLSEPMLSDASNCVCVCVCVVSFFVPDKSPSDKSPSECSGSVFHYI